MKRPGRDAAARPGRAGRRGKGSADTEVGGAWVARITASGRNARWRW